MSNLIEFIRSFNMKVLPKKNGIGKGRRSSGNVSKRITNSNTSCGDENVYSPYNDPDSEFFIEQCSSSDEDSISKQCAMSPSTSWGMLRARRGGATKRKRASNFPRLNIVRANMCSEDKRRPIAEANANTEQPRDSSAAKRIRTVLTSTTPRVLGEADSDTEIEYELERHSPTNWNGDMDTTLKFDWGAKTTADASPLCSQTIEEPSQSTPDDDLLHNSSLDTQQPNVKKTSAKRCRKGGFVHQLQLAIQASKSDKSFLDYDKKFGLVEGQRLTVRRLEACCGVQMAEVEVAGAHDTVNIVIGSNLQPHVHVGTKLEAYFPCDSADYIIRRGKRDEPFYVKPHRLTLVQNG